MSVECSVTVRPVEPDELTASLAVACGKLMPFLYEGDEGGPITTERLLAVASPPSALFIATLGRTAFTDAGIRIGEGPPGLAAVRIPFHGTPDTYARLSKEYPVVGQAVVHRIGGFRDGKDWLEDLVVHPDARGGSPSIASALYDYVVSLSRARRSRSLLFVSAPGREAAHRLYTHSGAIVLAGDKTSRTNLFAQNHSPRDRNRR
jgi:Acetyltransferase (GNAT) family